MLADGSGAGSMILGRSSGLGSAFQQQKLAFDAQQFGNVAEFAGVLALRDRRR